MDNKAALRPSFFDTLPTIVKEQEAKRKGLTDEEAVLFALSQHSGWKIVKEYAEDLMRDLDMGTRTALAQGLPFEEIGRNAVVIDLAKGIIRRILEKVEDARDTANEK